MAGLVGASLLGCSESHGVDDAGTDARVNDACLCLPDAGLPSDGGLPRDTGTLPLRCTPDDAREIVCPAGVCDGLDSYAWDGDRCVAIDCGTCEGADCDALPRSLEACEAAHAGCAASLCRATAGEWLFFAEECEHYVCGFPRPATCEVGGPVCDCGSGRSFGPAGCFEDTCPEVDPLPPELLCPATGGVWTEGICCSTRCGVPCALACAGPACVCGDFEVFDPVRGCIQAAECFERSDGETCTNIHTRCDEGLICCQSCGGPGCAPDSFCHAPVCDSNPDIDECGNNLLAP